MVLKEVVLVRDWHKIIALICAGLRCLVHLITIEYLLWLGYLIYSEQLGGDPVKDLTHYLGKGALNLLLLSLAVSPLARFFKQGLLMQLRRPLGLWCLFWATLHIAVWGALDLQFDWSLIGSELIKRTYIILGGIAWLLLLAQGVTSIPQLRRKMGRYWQQLHHTVYLVIVLVLIHYWWSLKSGWVMPATYMAVAFILLLIRKIKW